MTFTLALSFTVCINIDVTQMNAELIDYTAASLAGE
jgi:hypothetical protein